MRWPCRFSRTMLAGAAALGVTTIGCDRKSGPTTVSMMAVVASPDVSPMPKSIWIGTVAALTPGRPTMLAVMPGGSIFAMQSLSSGDAGSIVELKPGDTSPRATALTTALVIRSLGVAKTATSVNGNFTALAACADGRLAFAFAGLADAEPFAAVGTFNPVSGALFISVDFITLASVDKELATEIGRPNLFTDGDDAWLWRTSGSEVKLLSIAGLSQPQPKLTTRSASLEQVKDVVARSAWEWSTTATRGEFLLTDTASRWIRKIDAANTISHIARFDESIATITPAALDGAGRIVVIGNDRDGVATCMLVQSGESFLEVPREKFNVDGIKTSAPLRFDRLYPVPGQRNAFVAYEATSGDVVHVDLK